MKQLHKHEGKIVLIDWVESSSDNGVWVTNAVANKERYDSELKLAILHAIPTLEQDRSTWLELSERCGGKEIERLRGLIEKAYNLGGDHEAGEFNQYQTFNDFKTKHNI